ncbi:MAG: DUF1559 domain-containing protein [Gemmataceae bacterium]
MAASAAFKQACPSCEALVPIKDTKLVGKKIDCPNCKYRFVVKAPAEEGDNGQEESAAPAKKGAKTKTGPRSPEEAAGAPRPKPKGKKQERRSPAGLLIGVGLIVVCVAILGIGGYFIFLKPSPPPPRPTFARATTATTPDTQQTQPTTTPTKPAQPTLTLSSLLPNDSELVVNCNVRELRNSPFSSAAFDTPGGFRPETFEELFGFGLDIVQQFLIAENASQGWIFCVLETNQPISIQNLKLPIQESPRSPIQNQAFYLADVGPWLTNMSQLLDPLAAPDVTMTATAKRPLAMRLVNDKTLILADVAPLTAFLEAGGRPKLLTELPAKQPAPPAGPIRNSYLSIHPALKRVLDRLETGGTALISVAGLVQPEKERALLRRLWDGYDFQAEEALEAAGVSCLRLNNALQVNIGFEAKNPAQARTVADQIRMVSLRGEPTGFWEGVFSAQMALDTTKPKLNRTVSQQFQTVVLIQELSALGAANNWLANRLRPDVMYYRALAEMATHQPRYHQLADALMQYVREAEGQFPAGLQPRGTQGALGRPLPPLEHVSWMAVLLPYLGTPQRAAYARINPNVSWKNSLNLAMAADLVPAFLDPSSPRSTWWVRWPSLPDHELAATHFVGIAGVGLDAAEYRTDDQLVADKIGVFGYHRQTRLEDIPADRRGSTIALLQVPPTFQRPWIAGGGATVTGVPDKQSLQPFLSATRDGKRGAHAIMADGSVRFIPEDIPEPLFQAMCTLKGGDPAQVEKLTTLIPKPATATLKTDPAAMP